MTRLGLGRDYWFRLTPLGSRPIFAEPLGMSRLVFGGSFDIDSGETGETPFVSASGGFTLESVHPASKVDPTSAAAAREIRSVDMDTQLPPEMDDHRVAMQKVTLDPSRLLRSPTCFVNEAKTLTD